MRFTLTNVRNAVARPLPGNASAPSGPFGLATLLAGGAQVGTRPRAHARAHPRANARAHTHTHTHKHTNTPLQVEALAVPGVLLTPDAIAAYPLGPGLVTANTLTPGARVSLRVRFAAAGVLPADGAVTVALPPELAFGPAAAANASFAGAAEPSAAAAVAGGTVTVVRAGGGAPVYPGQLVVVDVYGVVAPAAAGATGPYRVAALTADGATIAAGALAGTAFGRPSAPRNVTVGLCPAQWAPGWVGPADDPRCVVVAWDPPLLDGGAPVAGYEADVDAAGFGFAEINERLSVPGAAAGGGGGRVAVRTMQEREGAYLYVRVAAVGNRSDAAGAGRGAYEYAGPIRALSVPGAGRPAAIRAFAANRIYVSWFPPEFTGAVLPAAPLVGYRVEFFGPFNATGAAAAAAGPGGLGGPAADAVAVPAGVTSAVSRVLQPGVYRARVSAGNAAGYGPPGLYAAAGVASPLVAPAWDGAVTPPEGAVLRLRAGAPSAFNVRAVDGDVTDAVAVDVLEEPGLPPRALVGAPAAGGVNGGAGNAVERSFGMTPDRTQAGLEYRVCFRAYNTNPQPLGPAASAARCVAVRVEPPALAWDDAAAPGDGRTPPEGTGYSVYPGCLLEIPLAANAVWYDLAFSYSAHELLLNGSEALLPSLPGASVVAMPPGGPPGAGEAADTNYSHRAVLRYQAGRAISGRRQRVCVQAADPLGMASATRCFFVSTGGCRACLRPGQTLAGLAAEYGTSWLQLWATNPRLGNPNRLVGGAPGAGSARVLALGVPYAAAGGETVADLAERFYTSTAAILASNPGLVVSAGGAASAVTAPVAQGQAVCIIPPVCSVYCPGGGSCERRTNAVNPGFVS